MLKNQPLIRINNIIMNKLNFYLALLALFTAVSVLDYIDEDYKTYIKLIFYITSLGFILKMMIENFDFKIQILRKVVEKIESSIFYIITWFMVVFALSSVVLSVVQMANLNVNDNILFIFFGILGALSAKYIKKKETNEMK